MRRAVLGTAAAAALGLAGVATALLLAPAAEGPPGPEPGRSLFRAHCATCHGADGRGGAWRARLLLLRPGSLAGPAASGLSEEYLADVIRRGGSDFGKPGMPSFGFTLGEAEIRSLVAYVRRLAPAAPAR